MIRRPIPPILSLQRSLFSLSLVLGASSIARAADTPPPASTEVNALATPLWALLQFVPSPETVIGDGKNPKDLKHVDAAVISHIHFDHLSIGSLAMIEKKLDVLVMPQKARAASRTSRLRPSNWPHGSASNAVGSRSPRRR